MCLGRSKCLVLPQNYGRLLNTSTIDISWMEMSKLIPTLFLHYNLELADQEAEWTETCL
jgi:hypothetical protein